MPAIPTPDLTVPYAAPIDVKIIAEAAPAKPINGEKSGQYSGDTVVMILERV